jgi:predicted nucleotidyltransferase
LRPVRAKAFLKRILRMKTREEYIALITSHAEELQNTFGITSLRLFGSVARNLTYTDIDRHIYG